MNQEQIVEYLALKPSPEMRTQVALLQHFRVSQATLVIRLAELRGKGIVIERSIGTSVVYDVGSLSSAELHGYATKVGSESYGDFVATVYLFGKTTCLEITNTSGNFSYKLPIYDKDLTDFLRFINLLPKLANALEKIVQK